MGMAGCCVANSAWQSVFEQRGLKNHNYSAPGRNDFVASTLPVLSVSIGTGTFLQERPCRSSDGMQYWHVISRRFAMKFGGMVLLLIGLSSFAIAGMSVFLKSARHRASLHSRWFQARSW